MKKLPTKLLHRLYRANPGDIIDNAYVRLDGGWMSHDARPEPNKKGLVTFTPFYEFTFKDLSDGLYYKTGDGAMFVYDPLLSSQAWFKDLFVEEEEGEKCTVYLAEYNSFTVSSARQYEWGNG